MRSQLAKNRHLTNNASRTISGANAQVEAVESALMEVSYRLGEDEFVRAQVNYWLHIRRRYFQRAVDVVAVFLIAAGIFLFARSVHNWAAPSALLCSMGLWMLGAGRIWLSYFWRRTFRRSPHSQAEHRLSVDSEGIKISLPLSTEEVRWAAFQKAYETPNAFLLLYSPVSFYNDWPVLAITG